MGQKHQREGSTVKPSTKQPSTSRVGSSKHCVGGDDGPPESFKKQEDRWDFDLLTATVYVSHTKSEWKSNKK